MDQMVLKVQTWLNTTYSSNSNYTKVSEDGITGGTTVAALITALQIEIGISSPDGVFGPATAAACPTLPSSSATKNEIYILQGALYCKGYNPNVLDGGYGNGVMTAIKKFQSDAGLTTQDGITTPMIFKALLNTDAYILISGGDSKIRTIQQNLNRDCSSVIGLIPSNGIYAKSTNVALIKALQYEEGNSVDGVWGKNTMNACPTIPGSKSTKKFILLLQYALYCNGYDPNGFDGLYGNGVKTAVTNFQTFTCLTADGYAGPSTWASLLVSTGDTSRRGTACDCSTTLTAEKAEALIGSGYKVVGRYLTGRYKMTSAELQTIFESGLNVFPIFETSGTYTSYFTSTQGASDAYKAIVAANSLGFDTGTIIYFAVDYDAMDYEVTDNIIPYFEGINEEFNRFNPNGYRIGIYGPRNICMRVSAAGYSCSSFVCDMSTGFSGNIGYTLPKDWAFDQISTITVGTDSGQIEIDNDICSGRDIGVSSVNTAQAWTPNSALAELVYAAGFLYDPSQDIIYSRIDPLQEKFGYCKLYDDSAASLMSTIIDCEPIYFTYMNKDWMIELWKGQYCLETGAEIGLYNRDSDAIDPRDIALGKFFNCVDEGDRLNMSFVLKKNGIELFRRGPEEHWWLTGFKWGEFTYNPSTELTMTLSITLKDSDMRIAFLHGLNDLGYIESYVDIYSSSNSTGSVQWDEENTVTFTFGVPKSQQPDSRASDFDDDQTRNQSFIADYNSIKNELGLYTNDPNLIEESAIQELSSELQDAYNRIVDWLNSITSILETLMNS